MEECSRCHRPTPPGPGGQVAQGWVTFEGLSTVVIDVPYPGPAVLPPELVEQVRALLADPLYEDSIVAIEPDPGTELAALREVAASHAGTVCPDCRSETGWDDFQWGLFLAGLGDVDR